jgi:hypothetical protein
LIGEEGLTTHIVGEETLPFGGGGGARLMSVDPAAPLAGSVRSEPRRTARSIRSREGLGVSVLVGAELPALAWVPVGGRRHRRHAHTARDVLRHDVFGRRDPSPQLAANAMA